MALFAAMSSLESSEVNTLPFITVGKLRFMFNINVYPNVIMKINMNFQLGYLSFMEFVMNNIQIYTNIEMTQEKKKILNNG